MLAHLDRFGVADRAELGRLLLDRLEDVARQPSDSTKWHFWRVIQDAGALQLAFGVCSQFSESEIHREEFHAPRPGLPGHRWTSRPCARTASAKARPAVLCPHSPSPYSPAILTSHGA